MFWVNTKIHRGGKITMSLFITYDHNVHEMSYFLCSTLRYNVCRDLGFRIRITYKSANNKNHYVQTLQQRGHNKSNANDTNYAL